MKKATDERGGTMEPAKGFEPLTCGLRNRCSTTELRWRFWSAAMTPLLLSASQLFVHYIRRPEGIRGVKCRKERGVGKSNVSEAAGSMFRDTLLARRYPKMQQ